MSSKEVELELKLNKINSKIIIYNKIFNAIPTKRLKLFFYFKFIKKLNENQQQCFRELRDLLKRKYPEKFIGG